MTRSPKRLSFWDHLEELRIRLIRSLIAWVVMGFVVYPWTNKLLEWFIRPVGRLVFTSPAEGFIAYFTVLMVTAFLLAFPFILFELWSFVSCALSVEEKKYVLWYAPVSAVLFLVGVAFSYIVIIPISISFFLSFQSPSMVPMITVGKYIQYLAGFCLSFGVVFEMPLVFVFLTKVGMITPSYLIQKRRHAIVAIFIVSAILTPPDYVSQILMALPLIGLYELGILFSKWAFKSRWIENDGWLSA